MAPQTHLAPHLDSVLAYGHGYAIPQVHRAPFLDTLATWAPHAIQGEPDEGLTIFAGATELTGAFAKEFLDELAGGGRIAFAMDNDDADRPDFGDVITYKVDGIPRFAGPIRAQKRTTFGRGDEGDEATAFSGPGRLGVLTGSQIGPARGLDAVPVEQIRSWFWGSIEFPDDDWGNAKRTNQVGLFHPYPASRTDRIYRPEGFPSRDAWWVWADLPSVSATSAPGGRCLFRHHFSTAEDLRLRIFAGVDNQGPAYFDGTQFADLKAYNIGEYVELDVSAGDHLLAFDVLNTGRHGGVVFAVWTVDENGLLDELVTSSDADNTLCFPYVAGNGTNMPRVTFGWFARKMLAEAHAKNELLDVALSFNDHTDTDGQPWTAVAEITADVGRDVIDVVEALADWLVDIQMAPGANFLRAWNWGTRGRTPGVTVVATEDPDTSEYEGLTHDGRHVRANRLWFKWRGGYGEAFAPGVDPETDDIVSQYVDLSEYTTEATARTAAQRLLANRAEASWAHTLTLAPAVAGPEPYKAFDNGDSINHLDQDGASGLQRVRSIGYFEDEETGELKKVIQTNDTRYGVEERHENLLRRKAHGGLAGGSRVASRTGDSIASATRISLSNLAEFSFQDPVDGAITAKRPAETSGNLLEILVEVSTEDDAATSSATVMEVWQYRYGTLGRESIGTVTVPAGEPAASTALDVLKVSKDSYKYRAEAVTVGGGVNGIVVHLRGI